MSHQQFVSVYQSSPVSGLYGNHYVYLDRNSRTQYNALQNGDLIEILWPDQSLSRHSITTQATDRGFYDRDADETFYDTYYWPYIQLEQKGATIGLTLLTEIKGIKVRKVA